MRSPIIKINKLNLPKFMLLCMLAFTTPAFADDELPDFDDNVTDNEAPIDEYIGLAIVAGVIYGYTVFRKKNNYYNLISY